MDCGEDGSREGDCYVRGNIWEICVAFLGCKLVVNPNLQINEDEIMAKDGYPRGDFLLAHLLPNSLLEDKEP